MGTATNDLYLIRHSTSEAHALWGVLRCFQLSGLGERHALDPRNNVRDLLCQLLLSRVREPPPDGGESNTRDVLHCDIRVSHVVPLAAVSVILKDFGDAET